MIYMGIASDENIDGWTPNHSIKKTAINSHVLFGEESNPTPPNPSKLRASAPEEVFRRGSS